MLELTKAEKQEVDKIIARVKRAQAKYATFTQEQVDTIFKEAAVAACSARIPLAKMAVQETGMGIVEDKVIKNHFSAEYIYNTYKDTLTCGVICRDKEGGMTKVAEPVGMIAGIVPVTNPTSTAIFKSLLALKTRNGIIFAPHPRAKQSTNSAAQLVLDAAVAAGAPKGIIGWLDHISPEVTAYLMSHKDISLILATGGPGMVHAAYSSGTPAIGVGAGNTPVVVDATAEPKMAVNSIILSKTFDHGMICASEQAIIVEKTIYKTIKDEFIKRGCVFVTGKDKEKLRKTLFIDGKLNSKVVGQSAYQIAKLAGIKVDALTKILIAETDEISKNNPFALEKLSPVLGFFKAPDFKTAVNMAEQLVTLGGAGHTSVLYTQERNQDHIDLFTKIMTTGRTLINMPAAQGAIGDVFNFKLAPSLTLGCGSWGGNSVSENIGVKHLMNITSVAERRENMQWFKTPHKIYFKRGCLDSALAELKGSHRAFIITDNVMTQIGHTKRVQKILENNGMSVQVFDSVKPDPDLSTAHEILEQVNRFAPDVFVSLGGGSPMDAAKIVWLMYEHPELEFADIAMRFMDIRKRIVEFPKMGKKAQMVAVPTTSGTGSEVTPFTVITDDKTGKKYPIADYEIMPDMAIVDPDLAMSMPKKLTAASGLDVLTHAIESFTSLMANNLSDGQAIESARLVLKYLVRSYEKGEEDPRAREKMHYAATLAGQAFANSFLGLCHSMAHKLGGHFHIAHGLANALLLPYIIAYNSTERPTKQGLYPQYRYPFVGQRYAQFADRLALTSGIKPDNIKAKVKRLIEVVQELKKQVGIPGSIKEIGIDEKSFLKGLDALAEEAFDDQCTGANARYPLIPEIKELYLKAYYGKPVL